jgi:hypothetical protein
VAAGLKSFWGIFSPGLAVYVSDSLAAPAPGTDSDWADALGWLGIAAVALSVVWVISKFKE